MSLQVYGLLFFTALVTSLFLTPLTIRLSSRLGALDLPGERKVHVGAVSRLGGVAMTAALTASLVLFLPWDRQLGGLLCGALLISAVGFVDDLWHLRPSVKFLGQLAACTAFVAVSGAKLVTFGDLIGIGPIRTGVLAPLVTVFCMVGVINALNLSDGLDGLAGGITGIACLFYASLAYSSGNGFSVAVAAALFGAVVGFLRFNSYPATLFMGDCGSLLLGYILSAVAILLTRSGGGASVRPVTAAMVLAIPVVDTLLVMTRRTWHGQSPFLPDKTHLHHRLMDLGLPHAAVVSVLYAASATLGWVAWTLRRQPDYVQFGTGLAAVGVLFGAVVAFQHLDIRSRQGAAADTPFMRSRLFRAIEQAMERTATPVACILALGLILPTFSVGAVSRTWALSCFVAASFLAFFFPWQAYTEKPAIANGVTYFCCIGLLAIYHFAPGAPGWLHPYVAGLSILAFVWVALKIKFRQRREVLLTSSFEVLLVALSWLIPMVFMPLLGASEANREVAYAICLEAIPLVVALKAVTGRNPRNHGLFAGSFLVAFLVIAYLGWR